jgi:hypothetical protein
MVAFGGMLSLIGRVWRERRTQSRAAEVYA